MDHISASSNLLGAASTGGGSNTPSSIATSSSFDAIVQNALNAGVAPQQVIQFLQANLQQVIFVNIIIFLRQKLILNAFYNCTLLKFIEI